MMGRSNDFMLDPYADATGVEAMQGIIVGVILLYVFLLLVSLVNYIISSYALYKIADNRKVSNPWLAWIPVANQWTLGSVVDYHDGLEGKKNSWRKVLLTLSLLTVGIVVLFYVVFLVWVFVNAISSPNDEPMMEDMIGFLIGLYAFLLVMVLVASAYSVCNTICVYKLYESLVPSKAIKYLLISLLVPFGATICLFLCRKSTIGLPEQEVLAVESVANVVEE